MNSDEMLPLCVVKFLPDAYFRPAGLPNVIARVPVWIRIKHAISEARLDHATTLLKGLFEASPFFNASHASRTSCVSHKTTPSIFRPLGILPSSHHSSNFVSDTANAAAASPRRSANLGS